MKIFIDPRCRINYASYYVQGITDLCPDAKFSVIPFVHYPEYHGGVWVLFETGNDRKYVFIDFHDSQLIVENVYELCDLYAKINIKKDVNLNDKNKLFPIGPSFGVKLWNYPVLICSFIHNYFKIRGKTEISLKQYLQDYVYMNIRRLQYNTIQYNSKCQKLCICHEYVVATQKQGCKFL
jgi:hypothetical protein